MAGLGKYKKGAKFTLKSGNNPAFKDIGSSSANLNNFGIGEKKSPLDQEEKGKGKRWTKGIDLALKGAKAGLESLYGSKEKKEEEDKEEKTGVNPAEKKTIGAQVVEGIINWKKKRKAKRNE